MKRRFINLVLVLSLALTCSLTFAQQDMTDLSDHVIYPGSANYITVGATLPVVVAPDAVYSPNYDFGTAPAAVNGSTWTWGGTHGGTIVEAPQAITRAIDATVNRNVAYDLNNYVDNFVLFTAPGTAGVGTITAAETNGGCTDATPTSIDIAVFAAPTMTVDTNQDDAYETIALGGCALINDQTFQIVITGWEGFNVVFSIDVDNVDGGDNLVSEMAAYDRDLSLTNVSTGASGNLADNGDAPSTYAITENSAFTPATATNGNYTITVTKDFEVENSAITRYTYTFTSVNDRISRKSDYWKNTANYTTYPSTGTTLVYYVKPAPNTGSIYVIPN